MRRKRLLAALLILSAFMLGGCNMVKGIGKDIHDSTQNVQEWIEGDAQNSKQVSSKTTQ